MVSKSPSCCRNAFFLLTVVKKVARGEGEKQKNIVQVLGSSRFNLFVCLPQSIQLDEHIFQMGGDYQPTSYTS